ncbi:MAG: AAC(3) family N-acetyltransferase [Anaerolineaceae bacterium]|nr:AAC(3) family N-acetyltransferase [Anaerolineaceae bacterium]
MVSVRQIIRGLEALGLNDSTPVIAHASLTAFGEVRGGAESVIGAMTSVCREIMMPAFTCSTMLIPEHGPENNAIKYGSGSDWNTLAEFYTPDMPVDNQMGIVAETLRKHPLATRSNHPLLSFCGIGVKDMLALQSMQAPLAPITGLVERGGYVLLIGVDHTTNTSIHYAEWLAGRKQFVRWAITPQGVFECPGFPGCSSGFNQAEEVLQKIVRQVVIGEAVVRAYPVREMVQVLKEILIDVSGYLLCDIEECQRCREVRNS